MSSRNVFQQSSTDLMRRSSSDNSVQTKEVYYRWNEARALIGGILHIFMPAEKMGRIKYAVEIKLSPSNDDTQKGEEAQGCSQNII